VTRIRLDPNRLTFWSEFFADNTAARDKSAAADSRQEVVELTNLIEELESRRPLACYDLLMIKWRNICHLSLLNLRGDHLIEVVFEPIKEHYFRTVPSNCCLLDLRRV